MMTSLFGVNISGLIAKHIGPGVLDATLIKKTSGVRTVGNLSAGVNPVSTNHTAKGFVDSYTDFQRDTTSRIQVGDRRITLIGDTISPAVVPEPNDEIIIEGSTYYIVDTPERDPASAAYVCHGRSS